MLKSTDSQTVYAARRLFDTLGRADRPVIVWVGAGASAWCGYPLWKGLTEQAHLEYLRYEPSYSRIQAEACLAQSDYAALLDLCRQTSVHRLNAIVARALAPKPITPVYARFVQALNRLSPLWIVTTNIDELLEKHIQVAATVSNRDIEVARGMMDLQQSIVCKLHGTVSDLESLVLSAIDYDKWASDASFMAHLEQIFARASILFIGYSLRDGYVLRQLTKQNDRARLLGAGPHFALCDHRPSGLPSSISVVEYVPHPHADHRASIAVLEELGFLRSRVSAQPIADGARSDAAPPASTHLLFHVLPPGTWTTSAAVMLASEDGSQRQVIIGEGYKDTEFASTRSTAMHDAIIGLLCFERIVAPLAAVARMHDLLGPDRFWRLVKSDTLSFVEWSSSEGILFPDAQSVAGGDLGSFSVHNPDLTAQSIKQTIQQQLTAAPGREVEADKLLQLLERKCRTVSQADEGVIPDMVRSLLLRPSVRSILGMSEGTQVNSIARWQVFPLLRLATVVKLGAACRILGVASAKLDFGTSALAAPAFACGAGTGTVDDTASYVLCGRFAADVGRAVLAAPYMLDAIIRFRDTPAGAALRSEVLSRINAREGADVGVAVNGALRSIMPPAVLQCARDAFVGLLSPEHNSGLPVTAMWNDRRYAEDAVSKWRQESLRVLEMHCSDIGATLYSPCPCGSGEKLKFCCQEALQRPAMMIQ